MDLTTASDIRSLTKPQISKYYRFSLLLRSEARRCCAAMASVMGISSVEYIVGVKVLLRSRHVWRYLYYLSFSAIVRAFVDVWRR